MPAWHYHIKGILVQFDNFPKEFKLRSFPLGSRKLTTESPAEDVKKEEGIKIISSLLFLRLDYSFCRVPCPCCCCFVAVVVVFVVVAAVVLLFCFFFSGIYTNQFFILFRYLSYGIAQIKLNLYFIFKFTSLIL